MEPNEIKFFIPFNVPDSHGDILAPGAFKIDPLKTLDAMAHSVEQIGNAFGAIQEICAAFNYPSELLSTGVSNDPIITEDAEFEIIQPKELPMPPSPAPLS
jgi:hypothetical protein